MPAATLLCELVRRCIARGDKHLFSFTAGRFRKWLKATCQELGFGSIGFTPHSLRHGGATADFLRGLAVADIQFRGRWKCFESLCRYLQQAESLSIQQRLPKALTDLAPLLGVGLEPEALPPRVLCGPSYGGVSHGRCTPDTGTPDRSASGPASFGPWLARPWPRSARAVPRVSLSREALR